MIQSHNRVSHLPTSLSRLPYPLQRTLQTFPKLCSAPVLLVQIPLGQAPFLHHLRSRYAGLVRWLLRSYGPVRLPATVHHWRSSLDFPMRSGPPSVPDDNGISRFPHKVLARMPRVLDRAGSKGVSRYRRLQFCLPLGSIASAPRSGHRFRDGGSISRLHTWPARSPVNASPVPLRTEMHDSGSVWIATPSLYESFIHYTLPAFTGAPNLELISRAKTPSAQSFGQYVFLGAFCAFARGML
jgi:hypothetical protein